MSMAWDQQINVEMAPRLLLRSGPLIPGAWQHPEFQGPVIEGEFLLDTGSGGAMIDNSVAERLGLPALRKTSVWGAHGRGSLTKYNVCMLLTARQKNGGATRLRMPIECAGAPGLTEGHSKHGTNVIGVIGRNLLQFCDLRINGLTGRISLEIDDSITLPQARDPE